MSPIIIFLLCLGLGIVVFLFLALRRNYTYKDRVEALRNEDIAEYTNVRDDLTLRDGKRTTDDDEESSGGWSTTRIISTIVTLIIVVIVFANIVLPVLKSASSNTTLLNNSSMSDPALSTLFSVTQMIAVVGIVFVMLSVFGVFAGGSDDDDEVPKKKRRRGKKMNKEIKHYTTIRDDLTYRNGRPEEAEEEE
jgi:hypothetical protein